MPDWFNCSDVDFFIYFGLISVKFGSIQEDIFLNNSLFGHRGWQNILWADQEGVSLILIQEVPVIVEGGKVTIGYGGLWGPEGAFDIILAK